YDRIDAKLGREASRFSEEPPCSTSSTAHSNRSVHVIGGRPTGPPSRGYRLAGGTGGAMWHRTDVDVGDPRREGNAAMRDVEGTAVPASFWVNAVRRNVALILVCGLIGTLLGLGYAIQRGGQYVSESAILIAPLEGNPYEPDSRGDDLGNMETEA